MARRSAGTWRIHFFQRHPQDDQRTAVPALDFLDAIPTKIAAEIHAVLDAVAEAPPPAFSGGGKWEAMHGWMAGVYEIRVQGGVRITASSACSIRAKISADGALFVSVDCRSPGANRHTIGTIDGSGDTLMSSRSVGRYFSRRRSCRPRAPRGRDEVEPEGIGNRR
jgi:hypothetical protein